MQTINFTGGIGAEAIKLIGKEVANRVDAAPLIKVLIPGPRFNVPGTKAPVFGSPTRTIKPPAKTEKVKDKKTLCPSAPHLGKIVDITA